MFCFRSCVPSWYLEQLFQQNSYNFPHSPINQHRRLTGRRRRYSLEMWVVLNNWLTVFPWIDAYLELTPTLNRRLARQPFKKNRRLPWIDAYLLQTMLLPSAKRTLIVPCTCVISVSCKRVTPTTLIPYRTGYVYRYFVTSTVKNMVRWFSTTDFN